MTHLRLILSNAITKSNLPAKEFARRCGIHLGLESTLRSIRNRETGCVLVSLNLRPGHLVSLISQNVYAKSPRVTTFAQPNLEKFTREVFGVNAVVISLPMDTDRRVCETLQDWIRDKRDKYLPGVEMIAKILENNTRDDKLSERTQPERANDLKETHSLLEKVHNKPDKVQMNMVTVKMPKGSESEGIKDAGKNPQDRLSKTSSENKQTLSDAFAGIIQQKIKSDAGSIKDNMLNCGPMMVFRIKPNPARKEKAARKHSNKNRPNAAEEIYKAG